MTTAIPTNCLPLTIRRFKQILLLTVLFFFLFLLPLATCSIFDSKSPIRKIGQVPSEMFSNPNCDCNCASNKPIQSPPSSGTDDSAQVEVVDDAEDDSGDVEFTTVVYTSTHSVTQKEMKTSTSVYEAKCTKTAFYVEKVVTAACTCPPVRYSTDSHLVAADAAPMLLEHKVSSINSASAQPTAASAIISDLTSTIMESVTTTKCSFLKESKTVHSASLAIPPCSVTCISLHVTSTIPTIPSCQQAQRTSASTMIPKETQKTIEVQSTSRKNQRETQPISTTAVPSTNSRNQTFQQYCSRQLQKERVRRKQKQCKIQSNNQTQFAIAIPAQSKSDHSSATMLIPYPFEPPKECSFMFLRMLRVNIYFYIRDILSIPIDIDNIRLAHCEMQSEIDDDEHAILATADFRNVEPTLASKIEIALERVEPASRQAPFSCSQVRALEERIPDLGINSFNCMPMKNNDLNNARLTVSLFRKVAGAALLIGFLFYAVYVYIQWNQLSRNTFDFMLV